MDLLDSLTNILQIFNNGFDLALFLLGRRYQKFDLHLRLDGEEYLLKSSIIAYFVMDGQ